MKLYENTAKKILSQESIAVPEGDLAIEENDIPVTGYPLMAKAQVLAGGRGKAGYIRQVNSREEALGVFNEWKGKIHRRQPIKAVLFENIVQREQELYLAVYVDGSLPAPVLVAGKAGGVEIESAAEGEVWRENINPIIGLQNYQIQGVVSFFNLPERPAAVLTELIAALYNVFRKYQCELVEINPLGRRSNGTLIALDAKIIIDGKSGLEIPPSMLSGIEEDNGSGSLEEKLESAGIPAVEMAGDIVVICGGAGCAMATTDSVAEMGGRIRGVVDLGSTLGYSAERIGEYLAMIEEWRPRTILINLFTVATDLGKMAQAIVLAKKSWDPAVKVVVRLKGYHSADGALILDTHGLTHTDSFDDACREAVR
jgi:succinyl-CoA synthetase beta subunit